jgi:hypothetical protein
MWPHRTPAETDGDYSKEWWVGHRANQLLVRVSGSELRQADTKTRWNSINDGIMFYAEWLLPGQYKSTVLDCSHSAKMGACQNVVVGLPAIHNPLPSSLTLRKKILH